jgi:hypothetical protein
MTHTWGVHETSVALDSGVTRIAQGLVCATLPTGDMERSRRFYEDAPGLREFPDAHEAGVW